MASKTNLFASIILAIITIILIHPTKAQAVVSGFPFGGLDDVQFPCTCSPAQEILFGPFDNGPVPMVGSLSYIYGSIGFAYYFPHPAGYVLGTYIPGIQGCWMYAVLACFPLPSFGVIGPITGTSP